MDVEKAAARCLTLPQGINRREIMSEVVKTPEPLYYAVIFTSHRTEGDNGYGEIAKRMVSLHHSNLDF